MQRITKCLGHFKWWGKRIVAKQNILFTSDIFQYYKTHKTISFNVSNSEAHLKEMFYPYYFSEQEISSPLADLFAFQ